MGNQQKQGLVPTTKAIAPVPATGMLAKQQMPFEEVTIELDHTGAWTLDGEVAMAFGPGAELIGNTVGVSITKPAKVIVNDVEKDNPYILYDNIGQPSVMWFRKIGVYLDPNGMIRYADIPDRIDISAYIAERAAKIKKSKDTPASTAVFCTREQAEAWNKKATAPGNDIWWFVPTQGTEIGIAFNLAANVKGILKFQEEIIHFRKTILRRFETATNRRVIATLVPEYMKTTDAEIKKYQPYSNNPNYEILKVVKARFKVMKPTPKSQFQGLEMGLYQQIARAIKEDNPELRDRALTSFGSMYGIETPEIIESNPDESPDPTIRTREELSDDEVSSKAKEKQEALKNAENQDKASTETADEVKLDPVPQTSKMAEFRAYVKTQLPKMTDEQKAAIREIIGPDHALDAFKGTDIGKKVMKYFVGIAGMAEEEKPPAESGEVTTEMKRKLISEKLGEGDKRLATIFYERYGEEWELDQLSDVEINEIYGDFSGK